jgi:hypothetical protein
MVPAPTPTYPAAAVISMFSNPYVDVNVDTWQAPWSSAQLTDLQIQGNDTKRYSSMNFTGVETLGGNQLDLTDMTHFRLDYWTANIDLFKVKLVDFGNDGQYAGGDDSESELNFQPVAQTWNTIEIPLTQFTGLSSLAHFSQLILSGEPVGTGVVFIDNVLFFDESQTGFENAALEQLLIFPNPFEDVVQIKAKEPITSIAIYNTLGQQLMAVVCSQNELSIPTTNLTSGIYVVKIMTQNGQSQQFKIQKN